MATQLKEAGGVSAVADRATRASTEPAGSLGHSAGIANALLVIDAFMEREGIARISRHANGSFYFTMRDNAFGGGETVADAYDDAKAHQAQKLAA